MPKFEVTVCRTGSVIIEANSPEEAMTIVNDDVTADEVNWADDWPATDAHEIEADDEDDQPIAVLSLDNFDLKIYPANNGYSIHVAEDGDQVEALRIINHQRKIAEHIIDDLHLQLCYDHESNAATRHELLTPSGRPAVIQLPNERLWCRRCHCYVPNTANGEMRKEGCFSHSHICGIKRSEETYLPDNEVGPDNKPIKGR